MSPFLILNAHDSFDVNDASHRFTGGMGGMGGMM